MSEVYECDCCEETIENPRYIDVNALLKDISETVVFSVRGDADLPTPEMRGATKVVNRIDAAPTADVVEVKHGEWIADKENYICKVDCLKPAKQTTYKCSECGHKSGRNKGFKYCPSCGAKMDGERKDT